MLASVGHKVPALCQRKAETAAVDSVCGDLRSKDGDPGCCWSLLVSHNTPSKAAQNGCIYLAQVILNGQV